MSKLAILFAGQGAQKTGMGKDLYDNVKEAREIFDEAERVIPGILEMCFSGSQEELNKTINAQPCTFVMDMACYAAFAAKGFTATAGAGFSLGEYPALCASGALAFEDTLKIVHKRSKWMQEVSDKHNGGMVAVLGKTAPEVESIVEIVAGEGVLQPVNYNSPGQTVVAGDVEELENLLRHGKENKVKMMRLPVNGAFHSVRMKDVSEKLYELFENIDFGKPAYDLYANKTAQPYEDITFKQTLADQASSPVRFEQTARDLTTKGYDTFVELGPGNALTGFMKRIDKDAHNFNINSVETLESTTAALKELGF